MDSHPAGSTAAICSCNSTISPPSACSASTAWSRSRRAGIPKSARKPTGEKRIENTRSDPESFRFCHPTRARSHQHATRGPVLCARCHRHNPVAILKVKLQKAVTPGRQRHIRLPCPETRLTNAVSLHKRPQLRHRASTVLLSSVCPLLNPCGNPKTKACAAALESGLSP